jgi:hypothetical protein
VRKVKNVLYNNHFSATIEIIFKKCSGAIIVSIRSFLFSAFPTAPRDDENELLPAVSFLPETLSVLVDSEEMLARGLNGNSYLQQSRILLITGISSGVLSSLDPSSIKLIMRRALHSRPSCGPSWRRITTLS